MLSDIFRFTLYWNLVFYTPIFFVCGSYAFWNYAFPPSHRFPGIPNNRELFPLSTIQSPALPLAQPPQSLKINERRSRIAFALIVLLTFLTLSVAGAVIGSAIMGFIAAGLYKAGNFNMST